MENDADILEVLDSHENKNGYIKELIREDIKKDLLIAQRIKAQDPRTLRLSKK